VVFESKLKSAIAEMYALLKDLAKNSAIFACLCLINASLEYYGISAWFIQSIWGMLFFLNFLECLMLQNDNKLIEQSHNDLVSKYVLLQEAYTNERKTNMGLLDNANKMIVVMSKELITNNHLIQEMKDSILMLNIKYEQHSKTSSSLKSSPKSSTFTDSPGSSSVHTGSTCIPCLHREEAVNVDIIDESKTEVLESDSEMECSMFAKKEAFAKKAHSFHVIRPRARSPCFEPKERAVDDNEILRICFVSKRQSQLKSL